MVELSSLFLVRALTIKQKTRILQWLVIFQREFDENEECVVLPKEEW